MPPENEPEAATRPEKRKGGDRHTTMKLATILLEDGEQIPCVLRDMSVSGAKLGVARRHVLPESFALNFPGRDLTCRVRRAWRRGDFVGVTLLAENEPVRE
ncbi:PilZ domain-containing protein [Methylobacterium planeticum]|uniref:PilZ domain-containing protein n=1 Tax=Methylobacterium planeticum TaxID=2615211 RepID=A0A6N6MKS6_9HYPH|nr:PilZ domain-containing protein [Methylobacterium planeticum]KAB1069491.1 PilZ domain-containing protein [Methylobacterium planeticum]